MHKGSLQALVPRGLLANRTYVCEGRVDAEGLLPLRIGWEGGRISSLEVANSESVCDLNLVLPRLVEPHAHIDKAFSWLKAPNLKGTYSNALAANLQELKSRTVLDVRERAKRSLELALSNGLRAIRSHVDSFGPLAEQSWEALVDLQKEFKPLIELQLVALVPLEYWSTQEGHHFAKKVATYKGFLGGVLVPPFNVKKIRTHLFEALTLANELGCGIDLHIDESQIKPAVGLKQLLEVLDQIELAVPITCSHASSMSLLPPKELMYLAHRLAEHRVNVVALPLTNSWLLGRNYKSRSIKRPLAPIHQLQQAGVTVSVGGDNVQDPWFPLGNFDPLTLMAFSLPLTQLAPWQRLGLAPFTTSAASLMNLNWDGVFDLGSPADMIFLEASSWSEALAASPRRKIMINGSWI